MKVCSFKIEIASVVEKWSVEFTIDLIDSDNSK